jgi:HD-GYP domain-containing protein (c-di-GMP phosphodiesterase class II)
VETYDYVHPARVAGLSLILGMEYGIEKSDLVALGLAALMMNIGYVKLPEDALTAPWPLSPETWRDLVQHPLVGAEIISGVDGVDGKVIEAIAQSHERFDGTGYPNGLKGEEISLFARILGMVDTYYALVSERPHRKPFLPHEAIEFVMAYSMELFDPDLVELFSRKVPLYSTGVSVKLSSNEAGVVADANLGHVGRPTVRILVDRFGAEIKQPYELDLTAPDQQMELVVQVLDF